MAVLVENHDRIKAAILAPRNVRFRIGSGLGIETFMKRLLLIKLRYIGDVILSMPLLAPLKQHFPGVTITFVVNAGTEAVLRNNPFVDDVLILPRMGLAHSLKFWRAIRQAQFETVVDLTDGDRSAFLSYWTGAERRLGFNRDNRWRGKFYTHLLPSRYGSMHMVDYHAQALVPLGVTDSVEDPKVFIDPQDEEAGSQLLASLSPGAKRVVLLFPSARYVFKAWPVERFAALADWLGEQGMVTALIGTQKEMLIGQQIINLAKHKPVNLMGRTRLMALAGLMKRSAVMIGNDGGPMHLAAAVGCPILGLFGPSNPAVWGPRSKKAATIYKGLDCRSCFYPGCSRGEESCMRQIQVDEVCQAVTSLLS